MTPGTQPQSHSKKTIIIDPQPLSKTANGGQMIESKTLQKLIMIWFWLMILIIWRFINRFVTAFLKFKSFRYWIYLITKKYYYLENNFTKWLALGIAVKSPQQGQW